MNVARDRRRDGARGVRRGMLRESAGARPSRTAGHRADRGSEKPDSIPDGRYERIYAIVGEIPWGRVATYGQVAAIEGHSTARIVGYALAALAKGRRDVPWQRVINRAGEISERRGGGGTDRQRALLEAEGIVFDARGRLDFDICAWDGPDIDWLEANACHFAPRVSAKR